MSDTEKMTALVELADAVAYELNNIFTAVTGNLSARRRSFRRRDRHFGAHRRSDPHRRARHDAVVQAAGFRGPPATEAKSETEKNAPAPRAGRYALIAVSDSGKGMSDEVAKRFVEIYLPPQAS